MRVALAFALLLVGASAVTSPSHDESADMLNDGEFDIIIDVRSESEYEEGHIEGAVLWSRTNLEGCTDQRIAVYCWTGYDRSTPAAQQIENEGYTNVYDLGGLQYLGPAGAPVATGGVDDDAALNPCIANTTTTPTPQPKQSDEKSLCSLTVVMLVLAVVGVVAVAGAALAYSRSSKTKVTDTADGKTKTPGDQVVELERLSSDEQAKASAAPAAEVCHSGSSMLPRAFVTNHSLSGDHSRALQCGRGRVMNEPQL